MFRPSSWFVIIPRFILGLLGVIGLTVMFYQQEPWNESRASWAITFTALLIFVLVFPENGRDGH